MDQNPMYPCLWLSHQGLLPSGILALQVDDTLFGGTPEFLAVEMEKSNEFPNSGRTSIGKEHTRFNSIDMRYKNESFIIDQLYYVQELLEQKTSSMTFTDFRSIRS